MALTKPSMAVNVITSLATTSQDRGLTEAQFKAKFDETPAAIKAYLNDTLTAEIDSALAALPNETASSIGVLINGAGTVTTPDDADLTAIIQSSVVKKITWANIKAALNTYFSSNAQTLSNKNILMPFNYLTASYTLDLTDSGKIVYMDVATANNVIIPLNSSVAFPTGTIIEIAQWGAGKTTIQPTGGVSLQSVAGYKSISGVFASVRLVKWASNTWHLTGSLIA